MRALLADRISDPGPALLNDAGIEVVSDPDLTAETLPSAIAETGVDVLVVRSTRVTSEALRAGQLKLVVRAGAGFNTIDVETASELGIMVANCPGKNAAAVAELAFGLIIDLDRHIRRQCGRTARSTLEQAGVLRCEWSKRQHTGAAGEWGTSDVP